jgi:glucosyl-dolichyl phosphate glucuronosyltransferase
MKITVILCTYNRCQSLARALESVAVQSLPDHVEWEVLVVDNKSDDQTREVVVDFSRRYPSRFCYLFEPQPGKSHALNSGLRMARGEVLAFIDDDVTAEPTWLQNLVASMHSGDWAGAGGRILPDQTLSPPRWLPIKGRYALAPLAMFDLGNDAGDLTEAPFGTNMAFRKTMFDKYGGFRTDLGPRPDSEMRNEDTEFGQRLLSAGERLRYEPSAVVYHAVPKYRVQKKYFLAWWFDKGRADVRQCEIPGSPRLWGIPLYLVRRIAVWTLRWMLAVRPRQRFDCKVKAWWNAGQIVECHQLRNVKTRAECQARM